MKDVDQELAAICEANGGVLHEEAVLEFARNPETALHGRFDWDDSVAAEKWRLEQARQIIRASVIVIVNEPEPIRVRGYVSLSQDRKGEGGYRPFSRVRADAELLALYEADAAKEFAAFRRKWEVIAVIAEKLAPLFSAADEVFGEPAGPIENEPA